MKRESNSYSIKLGFYNVSLLLDLQKHFCTLQIPSYSLSSMLDENWKDHINLWIGMFACISYFSFRSMLVSCIIRIFHLIYFFFPVSTISTFQIKIGMHFLIFFWRSFKDNIYIVISFHSLRRIYFVWANRDLPLRYNREEHCPTVIKAVFSAAVPFGKGFWEFDLYLPLKLQLPPPPPPNAWVVFEIREKQNKTMFSGRLISLISFFLFLRCSWRWMRVLWSRWMFMRKHWLMKPSNVPDRCHPGRGPPPWALLASFPTSLLTWLVGHWVFPLL